jgi:hypothetical protein
MGVPGPCHPAALAPRARAGQSNILKKSHLLGNFDVMKKADGKRELIFK